MEAGTTRIKSLTASSFASLHEFNNKRILQILLKHQKSLRILLFRFMFESLILQAQNLLALGNYVIDFELDWWLMP